MILSGDTSGAITVTVPAVAGTNTITLPAATGTVLVSGNQPAFSAYQSASSQTLSASTNTKITFDAELFDTNSNFASSRFTPTVAGYYQINACVSVALTSGYISIFKNGADNLRGLQLSSGGGVGFIISALVYLNGSTDYVEIYQSNQTGSSAGTNNSQSLTWFNGSMVRAA
jgi:hypothetical protein